jgi:hypothetical protein
MNFTAKGLPMDAAGLDFVQDSLNVDAAVIWAVLSVETRGFGFLVDRRPQILFERHIFYRSTSGAFADTHPDICNPAPGGYAGGLGEYPRLQRAMTLDRDAALKSASWGIAQIMGFNFAVAGFASVESMVAAMVEEENRQLHAMANFIKANGLDRALVAKDWRAFASDYNGKNYERNQYHIRLAAAYASASVVGPDLALRTAQVGLLYLGYDPGPIDGLRGRRTASAITLFQTDRGMPATGEADAATLMAVRLAAFPPE